MATRSSRLGGSSSAATNPAKGLRPSSSVSPSRATRANEKRQMQILNNRLASYIDAVRAKELEVSNLRQERNVIEESHSKEVNKIKTFYSNEVGQLRKAVDAISGEKARLEMQTQKFLTKASEAKMEIAAKEKRLTVVENDLASKTDRVNDIEKLMATLEEELKTLRPMESTLVQQLKEVKKNLEEETLKRTDFQNQLLSTEECMEFENRMLEQQLNESRTRKELEVTEMDNRFHEEYEKKMREALSELRATFEQQTKENQKEISRLYDEKIQKLQRSLRDERSDTAGLNREIGELRKKITGLTSRNAELESAFDNLQKSRKDLHKEIETKEADFKSSLDKKEVEIKSKEEQVEQMIQDYRDLIELKTALDVEIVTYRKLIEGEECRLGMSFGDATKPSCTGSPGIKRKHANV